MSIVLPPTWATESVFPGSVGSTPWAGQPCKVQPTGDLAIPGVKPPAETDNWWRNKVGSALSDNQKLAVSCALADWDPALLATTVAGFSGYVLQAVCWDPYNQRWIAATHSSGAGQALIQRSLDLGVSWANLGAYLSGDHLALAVDPGTGLPVAWAIDSGGNTVVYSGSALGTASIQGTLAGATSVAVEFLSGTAQPGFYAYVVMQSGGSYTGRLRIASAPGSGTWINISQVGAPFFSSGTNNIGTVLSCRSTPARDSNGARALFAQCGITPGVDTSHLMVFAENGSTGALGVDFAGLTGKIITGLAWDETSNTWGCLATNGTNTYFYTSPNAADSTSWTLQKTFTGSATAGGLAAVGGAWICYIGAGPRTVYSLDGGVTWSATKAKVASGSTHMVSSGGQVLGWNGSNLAVSQACSALSGGGY